MTVNQLIDILDKATKHDTIAAGSVECKMGSANEPDVQRAYVTGRAQGRLDTADAIRLLLRDVITQSTDRRIRKTRPTI